MNTITLEEPGRFSLTQTAPPDSAPDGFALVRVHCAGICGTDLHAYRGRQPFFSYPRILGHELGVEILEIGENDRGLKAGDRCAVEPYLNCGECIACRNGKTNCCVRLKVLGVHIDGGMREILAVPIHKLHKSDRLSLEQLALVETLGIGAHAVSRGKPEPGEWTLIVGAGPIGLTALEFATIEGARTIVMDITESRLAFSRLHGAEITINPNETDPLEGLLDITSGDLPTLVFNATGNPASMHQSFDFVASGGRLVFIGLYQGDVTFNDPEFHRKEMTILSSRNSTAKDFQRILRLLEGGRIDTESWISERVAFDRMPERFPEWTEPGRESIKSIVTF